MAMENDFDRKGKNEKKPQVIVSAKAKVVVAVPCLWSFSTPFRSPHVLSSWKRPLSQNKIFYGVTLTYSGDYRQV